jgi:hypothetical protein
LTVTVSSTASSGVPIPLRSVGEYSFGSTDSSRQGRGASFDSLRSTAGQSRLIKHARKGLTEP